MIQDFQSSGLIDRAAENYRVIVFDRPGFGHSLRPRNFVWTAEAQADLFKVACDRLSVDRAIVLGHSWGASVAVALAIRHPSLVVALVLASGYCFPHRPKRCSGLVGARNAGTRRRHQLHRLTVSRSVDVACDVEETICPAIDT